MFSGEDEEEGAGIIPLSVATLTTKNVVSVLQKMGDSCGTRLRAYQEKQVFPSDCDEILPRYKSCKTDNPEKPCDRRKCRIVYLEGVSTQY